MPVKAIKRKFGGKTFVLNREEMNKKDANKLKKKLKNKGHNVRITRGRGVYEKKTKLWKIWRSK